MLQLCQFNEREHGMQQSHIPTDSPMGKFWESAGEYIK